MKCPLDGAEFGGAVGGVDAGVRQIVAEHWRVLREGECAGGEDENDVAEESLWARAVWFHRWWRVQVKAECSDCCTNMRDGWGELQGGGDGWSVPCGDILLGHWKGKY